MEDALGAVQSVLVLGGTSEIAGAVVDRLVARRTRTVVLAVRDPDAAAPLVARWTDAGADEVEVVRFDARQVDDHAAMVHDVFARHEIDVVLLAFGVLGDQPTFDADPAAAARAVTTNFSGAVSCGLAVAGSLRRQGHGTLVVFSSVAGERVRKANFVYGASKAGLDAFAQGLGDALVGSGARVMVVRPGFVRSRMTAGMEDGPFATDPGTVAQAVERGLGRRADIVWAPGLLRWVFVVMRHLPRPLWRTVSAR